MMAIVQRVLRLLAGLLPLVLLLLVWSVLGEDSSPYLPTPDTWLDAVLGLFERGQLSGAVVHTVGMVVSGLVLASLAGLGLGLTVGLSPRLRGALRPTLEFLRMVPPPTIVPAALLILGISSRMQVLVVAFATIWPVLLNVVAGVRGISPVLHDVSSSLGMSTTAHVAKVVVPSIVPSLLLGMRVAAPIAVVVQLLIEMLTSVGGVGALLILAQRSFDAPQAFGLLGVVGVVGLVINSATVLLEHRFMAKRGER